MSSTEVFTGTGGYRVTLHLGQVVLIEIWRDGVRMSFGKPMFHGPCARCGTTIPIFVPGNDTMEVCDACERAMDDESKYALEALRGVGEETVPDRDPEEPPVEP